MDKLVIRTQIHFQIYHIWASSMLSGAHLFQIILHINEPFTSTLNTLISISLFFFFVLVNALSKYLKYSLMGSNNHCHNHYYGKIPW